GGGGGRGASKVIRKYRKPGQREECPAVPVSRRTVGKAADRVAERNAGDMEECGRQHEARRKGSAGRIKPHLAAVGVAMGDRKQRDDSHRDHERGAARERHDAAEQSRSTCCKLPFHRAGFGAPVRVARPRSGKDRRASFSARHSQRVTTRSTERTWPRTP